MSGNAGGERLLHCEGITRSFRLGQQKIVVLRGVNFSMRRGEVAFLYGASGAGKSTLLYTLAGLERPDGGEVLFEGQSLYRISSSRLSALRNRKMGFVFQSYHLLPELTAWENVVLPSWIGGAKAAGRAMELLELVGLADRADHLPGELSGGEQQRVAIARSLINEPSMIFADEPTGNLDSQNGAKIMDLLTDLARKENRALLVVTHDQALAREGCRVQRIQDGKLES